MPKYTGGQMALMRPRERPAMSHRPSDTSLYSPILEGILAHNRAFVGGSARHTRVATGRPAKQLAILACMDARLIRLLPDALGLDDGDAAIVKVAGAAVVEPFGEAMRSLLVCVAELGVTDVIVVGHTDCGTRGMREQDLLGGLERTGVSRERIERAVAGCPHASRFLNGFAELGAEVADNVRTIREHPLMPDSVRVSGFTIDVETGELTPVDA